MAPPIKKLLHLVTLRATTDPAFRKRLLADPGAAVYAEFGVTLPGGQRIRFMEKPADVDTLIVLPDPLTPGNELDDDDLDAVAGGDGSPDTW
jgi:hypothetical protein